MGKTKKFNLTEEVIKPLFDAGMTDREMADHIGCSVNYLERARSKHGIFRTDNNKKYVFGRPTGKKPRVTIGLRSLTVGLKMIRRLVNLRGSCVSPGLPASTSALSNQV